ncbi:MAG: hypothetical protein JNM09_03515 [Blastocatellia bacterium]|nr:hypothetical protein [Blastocatellia bacterium]
MAKKRRLNGLIVWLLLSYLTVLSHAQSGNQWRSLAPLEGGTVNALLEKDGVIYAGTSTTGIFTSSDNGKTWRAASNGLGNLVINALATVGGAVLAATNNSVYRSTDGGQSWTMTAVGRNQVVRALEVSNGVVFANGAGGVYRSTDQGQSWVERGIITNRPSIQALATLGESLFAGTSRGVFRSTDQGQNWTAVSAGLPNNALPIVLSLSVNNGVLYAGTNLYRDASNQELPQVYRSTDNGQSWAAVGNAISFRLAGSTGFPGVSRLAFEGTNIYALTAFGAAVFEGQAWSEYLGNSGLPDGVGVNFLWRGSGATLLGTTGGVYALDGQRWTASNSGLTAASVNALAVSGNAIIASANASGLYRSTDEGQSWVRGVGLSSEGGRLFPVSILAVKGNTVYAASSGGIYRSIDNGANWIPFNNGLPGTSPPITDLTASETDVYALSAAFLYKLDASGEAWSRTWQGDPPLLSATTRLAANGASVYALTNTSLLRSTDGGATFAPVNLGVTLGGTAAIATRGNSVYFTGAVSGNARVIFSTNDGQSFTTSQSYLAMSGFAFSSNALYASAFNDGVCFSTNGSNWTPFNAGLPTRTINAIAVKGETVLAGTNGRGVYAATNPQLQPANLANVSAASYSTEPVLARDSIVSAFGTALAIDTLAATPPSLPVGIQGTRVFVRDSTGAETRALLFYVSPTQVNYQIRSSTAIGEATIIIVSGDGSSAFGKVQIAAVAPGLFAANQNGRGAAAANIVFVSGTNRRSEPNTACDANGQNCVPRPIDLNSADEVFVELYGTGIRNHSGLANVAVTVGGEAVPVTFASAQPTFVGLDQVNIKLPRSLSGRGEVDVVLTVDGKAANPVRIHLR